MKKHEELSDSNSCLNKADNNELVFVLRAKDPAFAATIRFWADKRIQLGKNVYGDPKITEALVIADIAERGEST